MASLQSLVSSVPGNTKVLLVLVPWDFFCPYLSSCIAIRQLPGCHCHYHLCSLATPRSHTPGKAQAGLGAWHRHKRRESQVIFLGDFVVSILWCSSLWCTWTVTQSLQSLGAIGNPEGKPQCGLMSGRAWLEAGASRPARAGFAERRQVHTAAGDGSWVLISIGSGWALSHKAGRLPPKTFLGFHR